MNIQQQATSELDGIEKLIAYNEDLDLIYLM